MEERAALYVRIPRAEAEKLDRAAFELGASKQDLIAGLVSRYVRPGSAAGLRSLRAVATPIHRGRRTQVWQTRIETAEGKLVAMVTQTQMVL